MKSIIKNAYTSGKSYSEYRVLIKNLLKKNQSTTKNGNEDLVEYSKLNDKRMDRLDKKTQISKEVQEVLKEISTRQTWLVLTEGWCGDAAQNLPVINKLAEFSDSISLKIVLRDENPELMNLFLTNGGKAIPKLISVDTDFNTLFTWGPRPSEATRIVNEFKEKQGKLTPEFKENLQIWYNKNKGENLANDLIKLISLC